MKAKKFFWSFTLCILSVFLQSCSDFNGTRFESVLGADHNLIKLGYDIAEDLHKQAFPPLVSRHPGRPILSTTFVNNDNLNEASPFGRILQEHLTSRLVQLGYTVREVKMRDEMLIEPGSGELMLSRNLTDITPTQTAQAISIGTYSYTNRKMYISARFIDPVTANIISSVDYTLIMDKNVLAMFGLRLKEEEHRDLVAEPQHSFMTRLLY